MYQIIEEIETAKDVKSVVKGIRAIASDDEAAHSYEDALHEKVLQLVADGADDAPELAKEALKTTKLNFARWCA